MYTATTTTGCLAASSRNAEDDGRASDISLSTEFQPGKVARNHTRRTLRAWKVAESVIDDCELIVAELVSNAERHAFGVISLRLEQRAADRLVIAVTDRCPTVIPKPREAGDDTSGRGLHLVKAVSDANGWCAVGNAKVVWAMLSVRSGATPG